MKPLLILLLLALAHAENTIDILSESDASVFSEKYHVQQVAWRIFRTADNHVIAELATTIKPLDSTEHVVARFVQPRAFNGPEFDVIDVTDCLENDDEYACTQHWYMRSTDTLQPSDEVSVGKISVMAETDESPEHLYTLHYQYHVEFDSEADDAQSLLTVDNMPYITAVGQSNGSTVEGQTMCVMMRHNRPISPLTGVLCAFSLGDLNAENGCDSADNIITLFDLDNGRQDSETAVDITMSESDPNAMQVCYTDVKLGPYNQLVQVTYHADTGIQRRGITDMHQGGSFTHSSHSSCHSGSSWNSSHGRCQSNDDIWWVVGLGILVLLILCCLGIGCVAYGSDYWGDGSYGYGGGYRQQDVHPMTMGHGPRQTSQQASRQEQRRGHTIIYNKNVHNYDDADRTMYYDDRDNWEVERTK